MARRAKFCFSVSGTQICSGDEGFSVKFGMEVAQFKNWLLSSFAFSRQPIGAGGGRQRTITVSHPKPAPEEVWRAAVGRRNHPNLRLG